MSYTHTQISNLSPLTGYNTIRSRSRDKTLTYTLPYSKAFTSSKVPSLLGCWSIARIPHGPDGPVSVLVLETEFLRSRPPGTNLGSASEPSPREPRDKRSLQAVLNLLTPDTFASFSHIAFETIPSALASDLRSHDPQTTLGAKPAKQCQLTRDALHKILKDKMDAVVVEGYDRARSVLFTPDEWKKWNKPGENLVDHIYSSPKSNSRTSKRFEYAMKGEKLSEMEGLVIYWRNEDGSLSWVAGDDSLVPESAGDVSQPENYSHLSSQAHTGDYGGEGSDPAGTSLVTASACSEWVGARFPEAAARSWQLTGQQMQEISEDSDRLWEESYNG